MRIYRGEKASFSPSTRFDYRNKVTKDQFTIPSLLKTPQTASQSHTSLPVEQIRARKFIPPFATNAMSATLVTTPKTGLVSRIP